MSRERYLADRRFFLKSLGASLVATPLGLGSAGAALEGVNAEMSPLIDASIHDFTKKGVSFTSEVVEAAKSSNKPNTNISDIQAYERLKMLKKG